MTAPLDGTAPMFGDPKKGHRSKTVGRASLLVRADAFEYLESIPENTFHGVVTDPPYGVLEYEDTELEKMRAGKGGVWRIPPSFDGNTRAPLPRFTALDERERREVRAFFARLGVSLFRVIRPGAHVVIAGNSFLALSVFAAIADSGLEYRGQFIRLVRTLRGGDRPKGAENEFPNVASMPRGCYEPWGIFRKPLPKGYTVARCLREFGTGGLRRTPHGATIDDVLPSERTPRRERVIAAHPSLKPQSLLRRLVHASLPIGSGVLLDPFMGSGSTVAAAEAMGLACIGVERRDDYFDMALQSIPLLASLQVSAWRGDGAQLDLV